jgi:hypothetical protein
VTNTTNAPVAGSAPTSVGGATPLAGSPIIGEAPSTGRRSRDEDEARPPAARRSATLDDVEPLPRAGRRAAPEPEGTPADSSAETTATGNPKRPGDVDETLIAFWDEEAVAHFRSQWHEVKAEFVDDPVAALTRAHDLLTEAVNELTEALLAERDELDPLQATSNPDTENMRMAMRGYREFLDRILAL